MAPVQTQQIDTVVQEREAQHVAQDIQHLNQELNTPVPNADATNNMGKISELPQPTQPIVQPMVKPSVRVQQVDGKKVVTLDQRGMADLIDLYKIASDQQKVVAQQHQVLSTVVQERNNLRELAVQQEQVANQLRQQLATQANQSAAREQQKDIELYFTRALLIPSLAAGL